MRTGSKEARKYLLILNFNNMGKLYDRLQKQLKSKEYKKDADDWIDFSVKKAILVDKTNNQITLLKDA